MPHGPVGCRPLAGLGGIRAWNFLTHGHAVRRVGGSNPGRGIIIGARSFSSNQAMNWQGFLRRIYMLSILNLFRISRRGEAVNYRQWIYSSPSFEVAKPR